MSCNCNQQTNYNLCNPAPCQEPQDCSCPTILSTDCVTYKGDDLECSGIKQGTILTELIQQLDAFICQVRDDLLNAFSLKNIGAGAKIYKGDDLLGRKELRTVTKTGNLVTVTENTNDIEVSIDENNLSAFVEQLTESLPSSSYSVSNVGTGASVYKDSTVLGFNTQFNLKKLKSSGASLIITENTNEINFEINPTWLQNWLMNNSQIICNIVDDCQTSTILELEANDDNFSQPLFQNTTYTVNVLENDSLGVLPTNITSINTAGLNPDVATVNISVDQQSLRINMGSSFSSGTIYSFTYTITDSTSATSTATVYFQDVS